MAFTAPLVKIKDKFQVTLPVRIRDGLALKVGDMLEAELAADKIVLKPQIMIDRNRAFQKLFSLLDRVHQRNEKFGLKEVQRDVMAAIREVRRKKSHKLHAKGRA